MIKDDRLPLKEQFINYLSEVPSYRFASKSIKKSEDTTKRWRDEDVEFAEACEEAISAFVKRTLRKTKPEFQLERLLKDDFAQRNQITDGENNPVQGLVIIKNGDTSK